MCVLIVVGQPAGFHRTGSPPCLSVLRLFSVLYYLRQINLSLSLSLSLSVCILFITAWRLYSENLLAVCRVSAAAKVVSTLVLLVLDGLAAVGWGGVRAVVCTAAPLVARRLQ